MADLRTSCFRFGTHREGSLDDCERCDLSGEKQESMGVVGYISRSSLQTSTDGL